MNNLLCPVCSESEENLSHVAACSSNPLERFVKSSPTMIFMVVIFLYLRNGQDFLENMMI